MNGSSKDSDIDKQELEIANSKLQRLVIWSLSRKKDQIKSHFSLNWLVYNGINDSGEAVYHRGKI